MNKLMHVSTSFKSERINIIFLNTQSYTPKLPLLAAELNYFSASRKTPKNWSVRPLHAGIALKRKNIG